MVNTKTSDYNELVSEKEPQSTNQTESEKSCIKSSLFLYKIKMTLMKEMDKTLIKKK
jgi:hypothetical protein